MILRAKFMMTSDHYYRWVYAGERNMAFSWPHTEAALLSKVLGLAIFFFIFAKHIKNQTKFKRAWWCYLPCCLLGNADKAITQRISTNHGHLSLGQSGLNYTTNTDQL